VSALSVQPVVDTHVHVWPYGLVHGGQLRHESLHATPADLIETIDASGVSMALMTPASVHPDNAYVLGSAATAPTRLRAVIGVNPRASNALDEVREGAASGAVGVRIPPGALPIESRGELAALAAVADVATDLGLAIQWTAPLDLTRPIQAIAAHRPDAVQVLDHLGLPEDPTQLSSLDRIRQLARIPALNVKVSGMYALSHESFPYRDTWNWIEGVVDAFGPTRSMWASDWPLSAESADHALLRRMVDELPFLNSTARVSILSTTASRVWRLEWT